ncbi:inorganic phosphate transporter [Caminibacter pacificus]|jgi:PiT family inorganic phosphate transporter|uniref:Phosphate transporter n=1 Tax=Caminibacter pacificus TaxID=1424653 RepID=A0AAJ4UXR4_9BACT|nr:inorganic phosphate transporter [Caminibacter pacificus]NPA87494.1 inorganic phosphate transporter [Campylobacterota bacterium]QCI27887.1 inorganic phosphate transporter [Caminibacter pacificus]ROR39935.1 PiT family inorganic phosphate transporter [Caminibacter pacificus]
MELQTISKFEKKARKSAGIDFVRFGIGLLFIAVVVLYTYAKTGSVPNNIFLVIATIFGAYMAMNIGANDVANNVGPAVGSRALSLTGAIIIAAIFEAAGALIAGADVTNTIRKGIIDLNAFGGDVNMFIWAMMSALLAAALWLNLATVFKAPVSTTHSIVGGVMGAGIAAAGFSIVHWATMGKIAASWVISPVLGGIIAASFLYAIKKTIVFKEDKVSAAKKWVPIYVSIMTWAFVTYLTMKGLKHVWVNITEVLSFLPHTKKPTFGVASIFGLILAVIVYFLMVAKLKKEEIKNTREGINKYFTVPLIFAAALLSFAHGANDVANAVGPLAAIADAVMNGGISSKSAIPFWVMAIGALGISLGLALYGPRLIKTVGDEITKIDPIRGFCVALAAAITVIIASQLGLPVSSTHIAVGAIFGVGFLREWLQLVEQKEDEIDREIKNFEKQLKAYELELEDLKQKTDKSKEDYKRIVELIELIEDLEKSIKRFKKILKKEEKVKYVKRDLFKKIIAAWIITVPVAAVLAAMIFFMIKGMMV